MTEPTVAPVTVILNWAAAFKKYAALYCVAGP
jgi:hypothetical protein